MANSYPNTGSLIDRGTGDDEDGRTTTGLSTQIIIRVNDVAVGALQSLSVTQTRALARVNEIGTDGHAEIVPNQATTYDLSVTRIVFDQLRLPEAFSRAFRFIAAQRVPFDIDIFDLNGSDTQNAEVDFGAGGVLVMKYVNCWFQQYVTPYQAGDYLITETANIQAETGYLVEGPVVSLRDDGFQTDGNGIETLVNGTSRRGALDVAGLVNAVYSSTS